MTSIRLFYHSPSSSGTAAPGISSSSAASAASLASLSASRSSEISSSLRRISSSVFQLASPWDCGARVGAGFAFDREAGAFAAGFFAGAFADFAAAFFAGGFAAFFRAGLLAADLFAPPARRLFVVFLAAFFRTLARAPRRAAFFALFFFFFATFDPSSKPGVPEADHTIAPVSNREDGRVVIRAGPVGLRIEIRPLARTGAGRLRLAAAAAVVLGAALYGGSHLSQAWESGLRKGSYDDVPLALLVAMTLAVAVATPLSFVGLSALAFAEETIAVGPEAVTIETATFEKIRLRRIPLSELRCWRETYLPLSPWWTWALKRLAARLDDRYEPLAGAAGPREKRLIAMALAEATGKPLVDDWGRTISGSDKLFLCL